MQKRVAFIFPGQGSQSLGMLSELALEYPQVIKLFDEASSLLNYDVWSLTQEGPLERLNQTEHTQVAMLVADVAVFEVLKSQTKLPKDIYFAGHSLGEYAALVCAEALSFADAVKLVQKRGQLMQETVPLGTGAMAAIVGLDDSAVKEICERVSQPVARVEPANFNAIGQVVVAGHTAAVQLAIEEAQKVGAKLARLIPVSVPCHCALLKPASERFASFIEKVSFSVPRYSVLSTVDLAVYQKPEVIQRNLITQLYLPVRWVELVQKLHQAQIINLFECGPGRVLSALVKRIEKTLSVHSVNHPESLSEACAILDEFKESK